MSMTYFRTLFMTAALAVLATACGDDTAGGQDAAIPCQDEADCPAGYECVGDICVARGDGGTSDADLPPGEINIYPDPAQFGFAPLLVDTTQEVTIVNVGEGPLHITQIEVVEDDLVDEYSAIPAGPSDLVLQPNEQTSIQVTLRPEDSELDFGSLEVTSNDPNTPVASVALESEYKGAPALEACTLDDATPNPVPFVDCQVDSLNGDPMLDYGVVPFGTPVLKVVAMRNGADTNAPLEVTDVAVQSTSAAIEAEFSVRMFAYDTDGTTEIPVTLPALLRADDPANGITADVIYAEVTFGAEFDGIVSETSLVVTSSDPNVNPIPISAAVTGCPENYWDLNGDPSDGCEHFCVYQGPEVCNSGQDENCDGEYNTEDSIGCTTYFADVDNDTYGIATDFNCFCSPVSPYLATQSGDCDDTNSAVNPGATELCDGVDNDCANGIDDGFGTTNCGLGVCNHTIQICQGGVTQTCDPLDGASPEICDGFDNDCDGDVDEMTDTDVNNCGSCGNQCTNAHGTTLCSGGSCVPTCDSLYDSCDGDPDDGCETAINTLTNCGSCGGSCSLTNASETCASGSCEVDSCSAGYCDLDNSPTNGCEHDLDTNPACTTYQNLGGIAGDTGSQVVTITDVGENWYKIHVNETETGLFSCHDLCIRVNLTVPTGTNYDLNGYCDNCSGADASSTLTGSSNETMYMRWDEACTFLGVPTGSDSDRDIWIRVAFVSGNVCTNYTLSVTGNACSGGNTCSEK